MPEVLLQLDSSLARPMIACLQLVCLAQRQTLCEAKQNVQHSFMSVILSSGLNLYNCVHQHCFVSLQLVVITNGVVQTTVTRLCMRALPVSPSPCLVCCIASLVLDMQHMQSWRLYWEGWASASLSTSSLLQGCRPALAHLQLGASLQMQAAVKAKLPNLL